MPQVQVSPDRTEVQEGSTVRLYCRAAGSPAATITWEKQGGPLPPQVTLERGRESSLPSGGKGRCGWGVAPSLGFCGVLHSSLSFPHEGLTLFSFPPFYPHQQPCEVGQLGTGLLA